jgi:PhzF family phenazine biosynthesis protein
VDHTLALVALHGFRQVDVFAHGPLSGNPLAVVLDAGDVTDDEMLRFARWTNLSETTFVLPPTTPDADYCVRIFTCQPQELPFAGHPTLGTCHAWLEAGGVPKRDDEVVQECGAGLVELRVEDGGRYAFAAPPLLRSGPVDDDLVAHIASCLRIERTGIVDAAWADNGPGWVAVLLESADAVRALEPGLVDLDLGVVGPHPAESDVDWELRAFFPKDGATVEDPVTGSLNASVAEWLLATGRATTPYVAAQTSGRVHVTERDGRIWVGGRVETRISGEVEL